MVATVCPEDDARGHGDRRASAGDATRSLVGSEAILPLVGGGCRIIADEYVKRALGTGALKITCPVTTPTTSRSGAATSSNS